MQVFSSVMDTNIQNIIKITPIKTSVCVCVHACVCVCACMCARPQMCIKRFMH